MRPQASAMAKAQGILGTLLRVQKHAYQKADKIWVQLNVYVNYGAYVAQQSLEPPYRYLSVQNMQNI